MSIIYYDVFYQIENIENLIKEPTSFAGGFINWTEITYQYYN